MDCEKCDVLEENGAMCNRLRRPEGTGVEIDLCPLHAAAQELLKAAKEALDVLDSLEYYDEARNMLREAIAKAEE